MKYTLEIPDQDAAFVLELLRRVASVKLTPVPGKKVALDTTEYLMSTRTNRERLLAAMEEVERGETAVREWPQQ
jgi:PHD/YefM family antitoxin component YafN of YafNO toxin-antitoxin module